jgi:hypothetical protein
MRKILFIIALFTVSLVNAQELGEKKYVDAELNRVEYGDVHIYLIFVSGNNEITITEDKFLVDDDIERFAEESMNKQVSLTLEFQEVTLFEWIDEEWVDAGNKINEWCLIKVVNL